MIKNAAFLSFATILITSTISINGNEERTLTDRFHFFDIDLLRYAAEDKQGNVMISPASIKSTLSMLLEGSQGETAEEISRALRLSPDRQEFREQLNVYLSTLRTNLSCVTLENTNSLFVSDRLKPKKQFLQTLQHIYYADVNPIDFTDPQKAADNINGWVANRTHGLIDRLVEPFNIAPTSSMLILNTLYFKSNWKYAFNPSITSDACFYRGKRCNQVKMMHLHTELNYALVHNLRAHAVQLPYEGDRYSMILLVPHDKDGCQSVIRDLSYVPVTQIVELMEPMDIQLSLPRFAVNYGDDLVKVLKEARINHIFTNTADFSNMFEDHQAPHVNSIVHKTVMEVNEAGTIAAAATGAMVVPLMGGSTVWLKVDRAFLFFIRDNTSGAILFEGKIEEPEAAPSTAASDNKTSQGQASEPPPPSKPKRIRG